MIRVPFRGDASIRRQSLAPADQVLAELLSSRPLRDWRVCRRCVIGPYVLDYVYSERALVIELQDPSRDRAPDPRHAARHAFLAAMGYTVLSFSQADVLRRPADVVERIRSALRES